MGSSVHDLNQKLLEGAKKTSNSKALQLRSPGKVIPFPGKNLNLKKPAELHALTPLK